jgi:hypothetical protein
MAMATTHSHTNKPRFSTKSRALNTRSGDGKNLSSPDIENLRDHMAIIVTKLETHLDFSLLRAEIAFAFALASALLEAPHACNDFSRGVGSPFASRSGPGALPMRARKLARRGLSPDFTGGFKLEPGFAAS